MAYYQQKYQRMTGPGFRASQANPVERERAMKGLRDAETFSNVAQNVGTALGTAGGAAASFIPGAQAFAPALITGGGALGGALGTAAGGAAVGGAEEKLDPFREREMRRLALLEALRGMR